MEYGLYLVVGWVYMVVASKTISLVGANLMYSKKGGQLCEVVCIGYFKESAQR